MKKFHQKSSFAIRAALVAAAVAVHSAFAETPDELLEYVESTGTQYIDTGIVGKSGTKASMQMMWTKNESDKSFLAARKSSSERFFLLHRYNATHIYAGYWGKTSQIIEISENNVYSVITEVKTDGTYTVSANGTSKTLDTSGVGAKNTGYSLYLFAMNNAGSPAYYSSARCYGTKIWQIPDGGTDYALVRDFVPCRKGSRVGLWDRVSGDIFYPATGTLTAGSTVAVHAEPDKTLEYVEADGTQYVNTGIEGKYGLKAVTEYRWVIKDSEMDLLGSTRTGATAYCDLIRSNPGGNAMYYYGINWGYFDSEAFSSASGFPAGTRLEQTVVVSNKLYFSVSGGTTSATNLTRSSTTEVEPSFTTGLDMYLFARNLNGVAADFAKARVYSMQIYELSDDGADFVPVRNFTPCEKDGRAALYDSVSGMVFFGQGADLIAPPDLGAVPDAFVDYVESDGTQFIDTDVIGRSGTKAEFDVWWTDLPAKNNRTGGLVFLGSRGDDGYFCLYRLAAWRDDTSIISDTFYTYYKGRYQGITGAKGTFTTGKKYSIATEITEAGIHNATIDGTPYSRDYSIGTSNGTGVGPFDSGKNLFLFALNDKGSPSSYSCVRCYGLKIWQTDEDGEYQVVRDFKPCIKDGVAGLYDEISKTIFYPSVGKLRAADETAPAKFVEYVESDGTQYVDTCVKGKVGTKAEMTFVANEGNANPSYLLASTANNVYMHFCYFGNGLNVGFGNKAYNTWWDSYSKGTKYSFGVACSQTQEVNAWRSVANGAPEEKTATASGGTDSGMNLFAFARNNAGTADGKCSVKLYSMKIWQADDGGTYSLVRDFRPCVATNGIAALYDKMSGTIFYPQGGLLATGGVERAVAATARWKGGAVTTEADLAVAANWDCYDAVGNVVEGATPTAATTVLVGQGSPLLALPAGIAVQDWAGVTLTNSVTLSAAGDWRPLGLMTLANGVTVDLNGNNLVSGGFTLADGTSAAVANSGAAATLTFAVADGNTATMTGITFASNVTFAKTGPGTLVNSGLSVGDGGGESFTMSDGHCGVNGLLLIGGNGQTGTFEQSGGTLEVNGWYLTMGYKTSASGTYTMTGGRLFVRTHQMIVGQASSGSSSFDLSGTGTATLQQGLVIASSGAGSVNVHDGGRLRTSSITKNGTATLTFDGGILEPLGDVTGLLDGMPLTVGGKGFIVDTAGHNASFGSFTLTDGGELIKVGAGTLTITNSPAWSSVVVSNGTLAVAAETSLTLSSVHVAKGAVLDLGGNTVRCGALSGAGTVVNGTLIVTGTLSVAVGNPLTFTGATLDVSGAQVAVADPESITTRDPVVVATSDLAITGHSRTSVSGRRVQISQDGTTYTLELVRNGGFHLYIR